MDVQYERRRATVLALVRTVFERFAEQESRPRIGRMIDNQRWWRHGQEEFVGLRHESWNMPDDLPMLGWLDKFPEMLAVREAYDADPVLGARVDASLGIEGSRQGTNFYWILVQHVIEPIVLATRTYNLDESIFDQVYGTFERSFGAEKIHMVEFVPLNGFASTEEAVTLPDGLVLKPMGDLQVSHAINHLAVPRMSGGGVNGARISRFDQWALTTTRAYRVEAGYSDVVPRAPVFPTLYGPAATLITALRIVCGGSVVSTRTMLAQDESEFPFLPSSSAMMTAFNSADNDRPTYLMSDALDVFLATYSALRLPDVQADRSLQVAIRRLVLAGSRNEDSDRLVDLMISAEALFIKRSNLAQDMAKKVKIMTGAATLLAGGPQLQAGADELRILMKTMYEARNAEVHGDEQPYAPLYLLSGAATDSLPKMLDDAERVMRRAVLVVLEEHARAKLP
jgi:hypothetical protein